MGYSPDGRQIVYASPGLDGTLHLLDLDTGSTVTLKSDGNAVLDVEFSADGGQIVTGSWNSLKVWDAETGQEIRSFKGHTGGGLRSGGVTTVNFSPDSRRIVSGSHDKTIRVWEIASGESPLTLDVGDLVTGATFCLNGSAILSQSFKPRTLALWDAVTGEQRWTAASASGATAFSQDGSRIFSGRRVLDVGTGHVLFSLKSNWIAISSDDSRIASLDGDAVRIWDVATGQETLTLRGHTDRVTAVSFAPDGNRIITASSDQTIKVWDAKMGEATLTLRGHNARILSVEFSPDGSRVVSSSHDNSLRLWDAAVDTFNR